MNTQPRILVIEDEPLILQALNDNLLQNFEVYCAMDGAEGLELIQEELPHLILLDLMLPKMHGFEVLKAAKESAVTRDIPVIILSSVDNQESIDKGKELGAEKYLIKQETNFLEIRQAIGDVLGIDPETMKQAAAEEIDNILSKCTPVKFDPSSLEGN